MQTQYTTPDDVPLKQCRKCLEWLPATRDYFKVGKRNKGGLEAQCKACRRAYDAAHKDQISERRRAFRAANKERLAETNRAWRAANLEYLREYNRMYGRKLKERAAERERAWYVANVEEINTATRNRRARTFNAEGEHTATDVKRQYKAQRGKCYYCNVKVGKIYHVDHVIPLSRGGSNGPENIVIACQSCNTSKNNRLPHEWPRGGRLL